LQCAIRTSSSKSQRIEKQNSNGKPQRIERIIANRGIGSRKQAASIIKAGKVSVNGVVVRSGAQKCSLDANIFIEGIGHVVSAPLLAAFHKPTGMISTMSDNWGRSSLAELEAKFSFLKAMHPVGRLDADTSGLLLFSREGALTQKLLHPSSNIAREYQALVAGNVNQQKLGALLKAGVKTAGGVFPAELISAEASEELVPVEEGRRVEGGEGTEGAKKNLVQASRVSVEVTEGKYRMVRRVLHNAGHSVVRLHRVRYGHVRLGDLGEGEVRAVSGEEAMWAHNLLKGAKDRNGPSLDAE
jgi:23S rRNA pseudouridine2605 synthase